MKNILFKLLIGIPLLLMLVLISYNSFQTIMGINQLMHISRDLQNPSYEKCINSLRSRWCNQQGGHITNKVLSTGGFVSTAREKEICLVDNNEKLIPFIEENYETCKAVLK